MEIASSANGPAALNAHGM